MFWGAIGAQRANCHWTYEVNRKAITKDGKKLKVSTQYLKKNPKAGPPCRCDVTNLKLDDGVREEVIYIEVLQHMKTYLFHLYTCTK